LMVYRKPTMLGFYRIWVKGVSSDGVATEPSEVVSVRVAPVSYFKIGRNAYSFETGMYAISLLIFVLLVGCMYLIQKNQKLTKENAALRAVRKRRKQIVPVVENSLEK